MYSYKTRIRYSELDATGHLKIESLLDYFQDCSTFQSEDQGIGAEYLKKQHMVWVMSYWQIQVERYPVLGETVTVGTLPYEFKGFMGFRNFVMIDEEGKRIACANTLWSLIHTENATPMRPTEEMIGKYVLEPKIQMDYEPRKIKVPEKLSPGSEIQIKSHHLDTNQHVNNGQYVKIAMDCITKMPQIIQLRAEYRKQAYLNDILIPYTAVTEEGRYIVVLKNEQDAVCCIVELQGKEYYGKDKK